MFKRYSVLRFCKLLLALLLSLFTTIQADHDQPDNNVEHKKVKYKWEFAAVTMFQNEAPYLKEWIEFHKLVGAQHFYLYNNLSTDDYKTVLKPYIKSGEVELIDWSYPHGTPDNFNKMATNAFKDALNRAKGKVKWMAMLDSDEFLYAVDGRTIPDYLSRLNDKVGGVIVHWFMFGTSHVVKVPEDKLMIEMLTLSGGRHELYKTIYRPEYVKKIVNQHYCDYKSGHIQIDPISVLGDIRINHYWGRDEEFFYNVKIPRREKYGTPRETTELWNDLHNNFEDHTISPYISPLRSSMGFE
jgi:hypothetical protein